MPVRFAPFDAEAIGQANYFIVPDDAPGCACGANGTVWVSRDRGASWLAARSSDTVRDLFACVIIDDVHGWTVGERGTIITTNDGGVRWTKQVSATVNELHSVSFTDPRHGSITGASGTTLDTDDGGATWRARVGRREPAQSGARTGTSTDNPPISDT